MPTAGPQSRITSLTQPVGFPEAEEFPTRGYNSKLSLDYISQPSVGVGYDPYYNSGFGLNGGVSFLFSDQLSDNVLGLAVSANGSFKDIGGQALYLNRGRRLTYGGLVGHTPYLQVFLDRPPLQEEDEVPLNQATRYYYRTSVTQASGLASYPFNQSQRLEANAGYRRFGYDLEYDAYVARDGGIAIERRELQGSTPDALHLVEAGAAYVGDTSLFGFTSPIRGSRYRVGGDIVTGSLTFGTATVDFRHYQFLRTPVLPRRAPITLAVRALHFGRYGGDSNSGRLTPLYLGNPQLVRGYASRSFNPETNAQFDDYLSSLFGNKIGVASIEARLPLLGVPQLGLISFPYLPTELVFFADAGLAWGETPYFRGLNQGGEVLFTYGRELADQEPVLSAGVSARINLLGAIILEPYYAFPFSRWADDGDLNSGQGVFGFNISPGW